ncbi:MAG: hypothetical protein LBU15_03930 [Rickettsiales bacterium]|nr:hypothetical protein [Rickettsiales bacterium]
MEKGNTFSNFIAGIKAAAMKIDEFRQRDSKKKNSEKEDRRGCNYFQQLFETQRGSSENTENTENIEDTENTENTGAKPNRYPPRYPKQFALPPMPFSEYYNLRN